MAFSACYLIKDGDKPCPPTLSQATGSDPCASIPHIVQDHFAAYSPDGQTIAYRYASEIADVDTFGIYLVNADGSGTRLFHKGITAGFPTWSPDGQWIAFSDQAQIYKKHVSGDSLLRLTVVGRNFSPAWGPDGLWIAYDRSLADDSGPAGIWIMEHDGTNRQPVIGGGYPAWHPEGQGLVGVIGVNFSSVWKRFILFDRDGQKFGDLDAVPEGSNLYPKFSPDGNWIVFQSQPGIGSTDRDWSPKIWKMRTDGSQLSQLTSTGGLYPAWSPDSEWIIYTETRKTGRLWRMRPDGSGKQQLTFD